MISYDFCSYFYFSKIVCEMDENCNLEYIPHGVSSKNYMTASCFYDYLKDKLGNPRTLTGAIGLTAVASNPVQALMSQG